MGREDFLADVRARLQAADAGEAEAVARIVLMGYHMQLPEEAAREVEREMPVDMQDLWAHGGEALKRERGSQSSFARHQFVTWVAEHGGPPDRAEAERAIREVGAALRTAVPISDAVVRRELPPGILELWAPAVEPSPRPPT